MPCSDRRLEIHTFLTRLEGLALTPLDLCLHDFMLVMRFLVSALCARYSDRHVGRYAHIVRNRRRRSASS